LSIYYAPGGAGYLLASSQGSNTFVVYQRAAPHAYLLTFQVGTNGGLGIDGVSETDGIDVTNRGLGSAFPGGLFVAQDDNNTSPSLNQNFKLVPWPAIANASDPPLIIEPSYGPPGGGGGSPVPQLKGKIALQRDLSQPDADALGNVSMSMSSALQAFVVVAKKLDLLGGPYHAFLEEAPGGGTFVDLGDLVSTSANSGGWILALGASGAIGELGGADVNQLAGRRIEIRNGATPYLFAVLPSVPSTLNVSLQAPLAAAPGSPSPAALGLVKLRSKGKSGTSSFELRTKGLPVGPTYTVWVSDGVAFSQVGALLKGKLKIDTKKGQTLPLGVGFLTGLYGRAVEVRDGTTTVLTGTIPTSAARED
ncbi:MAG TPA: phytase, partial [Planctomycetota bacterium]|nr:phytase [Planctomycetota bacterium]